MKKAITAFLACLALGALSSCGGTKKVELTFLETMTSPERTAVLKEIIANYEKENPNVTVNLISPPYDQADNKLTMMLNNEQPLDVIEVRDYTVRQLVNNKKLENLEDRIASWEYGKDLLPIAMTCARTVDGVAYILPQFFYVKALFVRTDILAQNGITKMPETMDELIAVSIKITNRNKNQYGFGFRGKSNEFKISDLMILSDVANIDSENIYKTTDGNFSLADPQAVASFKRYVEMFQKSVPSDGINWGFNEQVNAFISGTTPFLIQDPDTVALVDAQLGRDKYTVIPLPKGKTGKTIVDYGYTSLSIPSYSKNKEEAWKFITFMTNPTNNAYLCKKYGPLPIHSSTFSEDKTFSTGVYQAWSTMMSQPDKYVFVKYPLGSEKWPGWAQLHEQYMQSVLLGKITVEEAVAKFTEYWK
ncbi:MAG: sugar ABC transporter substrate-binding protein [Treponema sp.]|nr:MAG: sugar ABC transporter substrate-binding protein [Treponema sp.]